MFAFIIAHATNTFEANQLAVWTEAIIECLALFSSFAFGIYQKFLNMKHQAEIKDANDTVNQLHGIVSGFALGKNMMTSASDLKEHTDSVIENYKVKVKKYNKKTKSK